MTAEPAETRRAPLLGGFVTAVRTLTRLPCPGPEAASLAAALPWLPIVGALLGAILAGTQYLIAAISPGWSAGAAAAALALGCWLTRGLHLDGLADAADGFGGGRTPARILEVMKDPRIGAFGVIALTTVLGLKWISLQRLIEHGQFWWVVVPMTLSRTTQSVLATALPYARAEGGTAAPFVREALPRHSGAAVILGLAASAAIPGSWELWGIAVMMTVFVTASFGLLCRSRVGGITGDLLGAGSELTETSGLFLGALLVC